MRQNLLGCFVILEAFRGFCLSVVRVARRIERWLATLTTEQKSELRLFAMDMHRPFRNAVEQDEDLGHVVVAHDPFHLMKRANKAITEIRKDIFFRAGAFMRGVGRGTHWLVQRSWERDGHSWANRQRHATDCRPPVNDGGSAPISYGAVTCRVEFQTRSGSTAGVIPSKPDRSRRRAPFREPREVRPWC